MADRILSVDSATLLPPAPVLEALSGAIGGGGGALTPDPENPGYLIVGALSDLIEDPDNPGYLITGA